MSTSTTLLAPLSGSSRALFAIPLRPLQGRRFQPTGFPSLGAARYGDSLLIESAQSMANRLELTCWDASRKEPVATLAGLSHVTVLRKGAFLTDSMLEAHRLNSPYLLEGSDRTFIDKLKADLGGLEEGPVDRRLLAKTLLKYDAGCLLHGVFLAKKALAGGRLRVARALSAFVEADGVSVAASGGVKNDHVNPAGITKDGFGNVPFSRDEFTADRITLYVNLDLGQIRGYGLGAETEDMLVLLALFKLRSLLGGDLRFRTACDLSVVDPSIQAAAPLGFALPSRSDLEAELRPALQRCGDAMTHETVAFEDDLRKGKEDDEDQPGDEAEERQ